MRDPSGSVEYRVWDGLQLPAEALEGLTAEDFEIDVAGRAIESFLLDPACIDREPVAVPSVDPLRAR